MKKTLLLVVVSAMLVSSAAFAKVTLVNEDLKSYDLEVAEGSLTQMTVIASGVTNPNQCKAACKITIKNGASLQAADGSTVVIKNGALANK